VATTTIHTTPLRDAGRAALARIGAAIGTGFAVVMRFLCDLSAARRCALEVEQLMALSDAELARRGIRRGEIVSYVLRNHMHE
jgi:hypothetical protein